jgi:hypothetical protein
MSERLWTTRRTADYLGIRPETLLKWDKDPSKPVRGFRISSNALRWDPDEIEAFVRGTREGPSERGEVSPAPGLDPALGLVSQASPAPLGGEDARRS